MRQTAIDSGPKRKPYFGQIGKGSALQYQFGLRIGYLGVFGIRVGVQRRQLNARDWQELSFELESRNPSFRGVVGYVDQHTLGDDIGGSLNVGVIAVVHIGVDTCCHPAATEFGLNTELDIPQFLRLEADKRRAGWQLRIDAPRLM